VRISDIVARAIRDAGCEVAAHVPGHGATAIFEALGGGVISCHEEAAYGVVHGAALCGARAVVVMKTHGLAKAANAVLSSLSAGVRGGLVVILSDDRAGRSSDNIFDAEALLRGLELPFARAGPGDAYPAVREAFAGSERNGLPRAVLFDADDLELEAEEVHATPELASTLPYVRDIARHLVCPLFTRYQRAVLEARLHGRNADEIERPSVPTMADLPPRWQPTFDAYRVFFDAFRAVPRGFTAGDATLASLFALPPYQLVDAVTYYGGSIPLATGASLAGLDDVWAVSGDFSFLAGGGLGLLEAARREVPVKIVIFANGRAEATGGQTVPLGDLERVLAGYERVLHRVRDGRDPERVRLALDEAVAARELRIVLLRY
jgi:TPP-dependent indolepyruvate ferredoxin oxidoreductase alpha subunit